MKKIVCLLAAILLVLSAAAAQADAPVHFGEKPPRAWKDKPVLRLYMFSTITNDSMALECGGLTMMVDSGFKGNSRKMAAGYTSLGWVRDGIAWLDYAFITHPHEDHVGGMIEMLRWDLLRVGKVLTTFPRDYDDPFNENEHQRMRAMLKTKKIPLQVIRQHGTMDFGGAKLTFFWNPEGRDPNQLSALLRVEFGKASLLLTSDITNVTQKYLIKNEDPALLKADIMKIPHHGYGMVEPGFLDAVSPKAVFVSRRQVEMKPIVDQLKFRRIPILYNSLGRIVLVTDGEEWYAYQERNKF